MRSSLVVLVFVLLRGVAAQTQQPESPGSYSRRNTYSGFFEYSNDSSHIILGIAENRKIGAIGFQYQRRLMHRRWGELSYTAEARPGMLESDPASTAHVTLTLPAAYSFSDPPSPVVQRCIPSSFSFNYPVSGGNTTTYQEAGVTQITCGRRTVTLQGFSPAGIRLGLLPRRRLQPTFSVLGGYQFSSQPVPVATAGSFNFTFEFGGGLEWFAWGGPGRSMRLEYQVQHFSNKNTASSNPGVDSGLVKLTYAFGR